MAGKEEDGGMKWNYDLSKAFIAKPILLSDGKQYWCGWRCKCDHNGSPLFSPANVNEPHHDPVIAWIDVDLPKKPSETAFEEWFVDIMAAKGENGVTDRDAWQAAIAWARANPGKE
jgi:hypothetical protein